MRNPTPDQTTAPDRLLRKLTMFDAVVIGLGSMVGAGIFAVVGPAVQIAGSAALLALFPAAAVAYCNAISSAQLASIYPESGGAYVYGRRQLGEFWGYLAGWGFIVGKLASCAAMALTFASYAAPEYMRPLAVGAVTGLTAVNFFGIRKTALLTRIIVAMVLAALATVIVATIFGGEMSAQRLAPAPDWSVYHVLQAAGLWFFAFAGYARIATLGEEVTDPVRTIPRAIPLALGITFAIYVAIVGSTILSVDVGVLAQAASPLATAVEAGRFAALSPIVRIGATIASLGVLLSLIVGISRTVFAMSDNRDLPKVFATVHPRFGVPHRAELAVGTLIIIIVLISDLRTAVGFSSFTVLVYYAITNMAALSLDDSLRFRPRLISIAGLIGCLALAFLLPLESVAGGSIVLLLGIGLYGVMRRMRRV